MTGLIPLGFSQRDNAIAAGAVAIRAFNREQNEPPLRIIGLHASFPIGLPARDFTWEVANRLDTIRFEFMCRQGIGALNPEMIWKDGNLVATAAAGAHDAILPFIDIPPGGHLVVTPTAGTLGTLTTRILGYELTKDIIARSLLATDPNTISITPDNVISLLNQDPTFSAQGGGIP